MYVFIADESIVRESTVHRLSIYGGLILDEETFQEFSTVIYKIKEKYLYPQELELKWRFQTVWESMKRIGYVQDDATTKESRESFKKDYDVVKNEILKIISESNAKIVIAIRPNALLHASDELNVEYSIAAIARKFEKILDREGEIGIILADELKKRLYPEDKMDYQYILNLCCYGAGLGKFENLTSIVPTINSCVSPIHQINDILLGAVQYYLLEFSRSLVRTDYDFELSKSFVTLIKDNFYQSVTGGYTINSGILLYPPKSSRKATPAGIFLNKLQRQLTDDFGII